MSEEEALLAAIRADPHDDTVRLGYCDWLDEQGTEWDSMRAAFIRRSIAKYKRFTFEPGVAAQVDNLISLESGRPGISWITRRGFIDGVQCTWGAWLINCDTILERHPICFVALDSPVRLNGIPISGESWIPGRKKRCFTGEEIAAFKTTRNKAFPHRGAAVLEMTFPHIEFEQSENFRMDYPQPTEGSWGSDPARAMR